ncbi:MAG: alpha-N-arabinofuranosidase [Verrucomicrobiae bacterium]|nr:alpha-N-arabinofuranosidase [Verrucomicrobiae bacterium]
MKIKFTTPIFAIFALLLFSPADKIFAGESTNLLVIKASDGKFKINRNIYGHFSEHLGKCVYEGYWVGEDSQINNVRGIRKDVVEALKKIKVPVLRWPGGCFADEYHWMDGVGPREKRPKMINTHWGGVVENNHFGTHEFLDLCAQLDCEPYICGNVGSGTVKELSDWVDYVNSEAGTTPMAELREKNGQKEPWKVRYWGVGNENWGCGGNMRPEYYADLYKRYATYVRNRGKTQPYKIACGPNSADYNWTEVLMREAGRRMNGLSLHYYCGSGRKSRSATNFGEEDWHYLLKNALRMEELIQKHSAIMDKYDPQKRVALIVDEWGTWHAVEPGTNPGFLYQQNTLRDALVAGATLNIFNRYCERVKMANIAQTVNVLQAMILTRGEKIIVTPTYHVFEMYTVHHDATMLPVELTCEEYKLGNDTIPALNVSASKDSEGKMHVSLCNFNPNKDIELECQVPDVKISEINGRVLTAETMNAHNTFENPNNVKSAEFKNFKIADKGFTVKLPSKSVVVLSLK